MWEFWERKKHGLDKKWSAMDIKINRQLNCPIKMAMVMEPAIQNNALTLPLGVMPWDLDS